MFILRQVSEKGESNTNLGNSYTFTQAPSEEFKRLMLILDPDGIPNQVAYVHSSNGEAYRVFSHHSTYIMTDTGKTFARLT